MNVKQFRYSRDNFSYLIDNGTIALAIDPGASGNILNYLKERGLKLLYAANTHSHYDHTHGNADILKQSGAEYLDNKTLIKKGKIVLGNEILVYHTPGHSEDSICFHTGNYLISGDTLFNGTIGNCFSGNLRAFYDSIKLIMSLPKETIVYAGHDYIRDSMKYAGMMVPDNPYIEEFLRKLNPDDIFSTLEDELNINPFLRFNDPGIIALLKRKGLPVDTEFDRWKALMS